MESIWGEVILIVVSKGNNHVSQEHVPNDNIYLIVFKWYCGNGILNCLHKTELWIQMVQ